MTEQEWVGTTRPLPMETFLHKSNASERKRLLIGPACCRMIWELLTDPRSRAAVVLAEELVDEPRGSDRGQSENEAAVQAWRSFDFHTRCGSAALAAHLSLGLCRRWHGRGRWENNVGDVMLKVRDAEDDYSGSWGRYVLPGDPNFQPDHPRQADLLRDIFGNPFRPVAFDPSWRTGTVASLAKGMYESREFSPMPILADALQDAGCENDDVLKHCRDPKAAHVRGCWVVDLVLGKS
ncbi:MAG TPA: hypothetical protein VKE74_25025 [Gemmataceae bacterium]|nr:hypothetical protein [Gemmataceae bacterium]